MTTQHPNRGKIQSQGLFETGFKGGGGGVTQRSETPQPQADQQQTTEKGVGVTWAQRPYYCSCLPQLLQNFPSLSLSLLQCQHFLAKTLVEGVGPGAVSVGRWCWDDVFQLLSEAELQVPPQP